MKKVLKIIGIVIIIIVIIVIVLVIYLINKPAVPNHYWTKINSNSVIENNYNKLGDYQVQTKKYNINKKNYYQAWYPKEKGKYPLIVMVNGTGVPCSKYEPVFKHMASYGYVVIGNNYATSWDGLHTSETLQFALDSRDLSLIINKDQIAVGGHSQGGMGTFNAITEYENGSLYKAAFSLSPTNDELAIGLKWGFHLGTEKEYAFRLKQVKIPMLIGAGSGKFDSETVSPANKMYEEYNALSGDKVMFVRSDDVDHQKMLYESNGYIIAWLDYCLKEKKENEEIFYGKHSDLSNNSRYQNVKSKQND